MTFGFFGKVPQKGDYLALNLPPAVLTPLETWLAAALAASHAELGAHWETHFLVAPIWHFWLPRSALGVSLTGSLMSSVDSGGRYFPATMIYVGTKARSVAPPSEWDGSCWYDALDARLLSVLSQQDDDYLPGLLEGLTPPAAFESTQTHSFWWPGPTTSGTFDPFEADGLPAIHQYGAMLTGR